MNLHGLESASCFENFNSRFHIITNAYPFASAHNKSRRILNYIIILKSAVTIRGKKFLNADYH